MEQDRQGKKTEDSRLQGGGEVVRRDVGVLCGQLGEREDPDSHGGLVVVRLKRQAQVLTQCFLPYTFIGLY